MSHSGITVGAVAVKTVELKNCSDSPLLDGALYDIGCQAFRALRGEWQEIDLYCASRHIVPGHSRREKSTVNNLTTYSLQPL